MSWAQIQIRSLDSELTSFQRGKACLLRKELLGVFKRGLISPLSAGSLRTFFFGIYWAKVVEHLEGNLAVLWGPQAWSPRSFSSQRCLQGASSCTSRSPVLALWASQPGRRRSRKSQSHLFVCLWSGGQGRQRFAVPSRLMNPGRMIFQSAELFTCWDGAVSFELLTRGTHNRLSFLLCVLFL